MAKKTFVVWYNVVDTWKVTFEADSIEEARTAVSLVRDSEKPVAWLLEEFDGTETNKGIDLEFDEPEEVN